MKPVLARRHAARLDTVGLEHVLPKIQSIIEASRQHVVSTANLMLVWLNWNVGRIISEEIQQHAGRAEYGERLLEALGQRVTKQYGSGYSARSLWDMRRFFTDFKILPPLVAESSPDQSDQPVARQSSPHRLTINFSKHAHLGWTHYRILLSVEAGLKRGFYFEQAASQRWSKQRVPDIRQALGVPDVTAETIKRLFFDFVDEMDMAASYKPVLMLAFLDSASNRGRARMVDVVARFRAFFEARVKAGLVVERATMRMARVTEMSEGDVQNVIVSMPLRKFQQRRYLEYSRDVAWLQFNTDLWKQCSDADLAHVRQLCHRGIEHYYGRLAPVS